MAKIYLARHAESIANTEGRYQGITYDTDLSELGIKQALALAERFREIAIERIICSPLKRTYQTAFAVGNAKKITVIREVRIIETNHGAWEGKRKDEIKKYWPVIYKRWLKFPSNVTFPDGEDFLETQKRVLMWLKELYEYQTDTLIVTHDNIIRIIIAKIINMKLNRIWKFHLHPTAITLMTISNGRIEITSLNDIEHVVNLQTNLAIHAL